MTGLGRAPGQAEMVEREGLHNRRFDHPRAEGSAPAPPCATGAAPAEVSLERSGAIANRIQTLRPTRISSYPGRPGNSNDNRRTDGGSDTWNQRTRPPSCRDERRLLEAARVAEHS